MLLSLFFLLFYFVNCFSLFHFGLIRKTLSEVCNLHILNDEGNDLLWLYTLTNRIEEN